MKKAKIDNAIMCLAYQLSDEYEFYLSTCLSWEEEQAEQEIKEAYEILDWYGIDFTAVEKHYKRQLNKTDEPLRFIDRFHFTKVETDELAF